MADEHKEEHGASGGESHAKGHSGGHGGGGHGGGGSHEEHEGAPEWLISFADNVALMMGFFVILLAMNMQKPQMGGVGGEGKYPSDEKPEMDDFVVAMRAAFNNPMDESNPADRPMLQRIKLRATEGGATKEPGMDGQDHNVKSLKNSDWTTPVAIATFVDFETALNDEGKQQMVQAAQKFKGQRWMIEVRGHVSATEAHGNVERGYNLSYQRAMGAAQELVANGLTWEQIRVVGCTDNERGTPRAGTAAEHQSNQRVVVIQTQEPVPGDPFNGSGGN